MSVHGHVRSGTHWLRAVLKINFGTLSGHSGHHSLPGLWIHKLPEVFYIKRNWEDTSRSMWAMKERFGIGAATFEEFVCTPWKKQWKSFPPSSLEIGPYFRRRTKLVGTNVMFQGDSRTPEEFHATHVSRWADFKASNLMIVDYDLLLSDFEEVMLEIAKALDSNKTSFENVPRTGTWKASHSQ